VQRSQHGTLVQSLPPPIGAEEEGVTRMEADGITQGGAWRDFPPERLQKSTPVPVATDILFLNVSGAKEDLGHAVIPGAGAHRPSAEVIEARVSDMDPSGALSLDGQQDQSCAPPDSSAGGIAARRPLHYGLMGRIEDGPHPLPVEGGQRPEERQRTLDGQPRRLSPAPMPSQPVGQSEEKGAACLGNAGAVLILVCRPRFRGRGPPTGEGVQMPPSGSRRSSSPAVPSRMVQTEDCDRTLLT
jgi:hypothetical protein